MFSSKFYPSADNFTPSRMVWMVTFCKSVLHPLCSYCHYCTFYENCRMHYCYYQHLWYCCPYYPYCYYHRNLNLQKPFTLPLVQRSPQLQEAWYADEQRTCKVPGISCSTIIKIGAGPTKFILSLYFLSPDKVFSCPVPRPSTAGKIRWHFPYTVSPYYVPIQCSDCIVMDWTVLYCTVLCLYCDVL